MENEWISKEIGDLFRIENGFAFKSEDFVEEGIPIIKIKNVKAGYFKKEGFSYVSPDYLAKRPKRKLE